MGALPRADLAAFAAHCARAGLPEEAAVAAGRAAEELTALVALLQGAPDKVPPALEAAGVPQTLIGFTIRLPMCHFSLHADVRVHCDSSNTYARI